MVKQKTWLLILLFIVFIGAAGFAIDRILFVPALIFGLIISLFTYFFIEPISIFYHAGKQTIDLRLIEVITNLAFKADMACPKIYEFKSDKPIIFTTGRDQKHASLCLSSGLREKLNKQELEALVARELFHISQNDIGMAIIHTMTSWKREFEADAFAAKLTADPESLISALEKIGRVNPFHPPTETRVKLLRAM